MMSTKNRSKFINLMNFVRSAMDLRNQALGTNY